MRSRWLRLVQWVAGLAILWFAGRSLLRNWHDLGAQPLAWRIDPIRLVAAALVVWAMYALLVTAWRVMLVILLSTSLRSWSTRTTLANSSCSLIRSGIAD